MLGKVAILTIVAHRALSFTPRCSVSASRLVRAPTTCLSFARIELEDEELCTVHELNIALAQRDAVLKELDRSNAERQLLAASLKQTEATLAEYRALIDAHQLMVSKAVGGKKKRTKHQMRDDIISAIVGPDYRIPLEDYQAGLLDTVKHMAPLPANREIAQHLANVVAYLCEWVTPGQARDIIRKELDSLPNVLGD